MTQSRHRGSGGRRDVVVPCGSLQTAAEVSRDRQHVEVTSIKLVEIRHCSRGATSAAALMEIGD